MSFAEICEMHSPESRVRLESAVARALNTGKPYELDFELHLKDGSTRWIIDRCEVEMQPDGKVAALRGTLQEITERKKNEQQIAFGESRYRSLVRATSEIVWTTQADGLQSSGASEWVKFTGQSEESVTGFGWADSIHPDDRERTIAAWIKAAKSGNIFEVEHRVRRRDNVYRDMQTRAVPVRNTAGQIMEWVGTHTDITGRKLAERALHESESRFNKLFESDLMGIGVPDRFGAFTEANDELLRIVGYSREDLEAGLVRWDTMTPLEYKEIDEAHIAEAAQRGSCTPYEKEYFRKDGTRVPILCGYALLEGTQDRYIGFVQDLTAQKRAEGALRKAEKLATAGRFAASMAHEINNPLAAVTNAVYLALQKSDLDEEVRGILNMADRELARVSQVVTQNLRFHRQLTAPQSANLCDVMESVLMLLGSRLTASNIEIKREYRAQEKLWYFGNDLRHAFASLISNSLDAAVEGMYLRVRIKPGRAWSGSEEPGIRVTVADTGQGIPSHLVKRVFEAFVTTKESTGTGLGLWVTEEIVSKHKGRIALRSSTRLPQHGTVVMLFFPFDGVRKS